MLLMELYTIVFFQRKKIIKNDIIKLIMPTEKDLKIAKEIKHEIKKKLGDKLISVTLYGSRARGDFHDESDMDLFLLTKRQIKVNTPEEKKISNTTYKFMLKYGFMVSAIAYSQYKYNRYKKYMPLLHWVGKEGIEL